MVFSGENCLKCGFQHSDPAVVGRKSGTRENAYDDNCIISLSFRQTRDDLPGKAGCRLKGILRRAHLRQHRLISDYAQRVGSADFENQRAASSLRVVSILRMSSTKLSASRNVRLPKFIWLPPSASMPPTTARNCDFSKRLTDFS